MENNNKQELKVSIIVPCGKCISESISENVNNTAFALRKAMEGFITSATFEEFNQRDKASITIRIDKQIDVI